MFLCLLVFVSFSLSFCFFAPFTFCWFFVFTTLLLGLLVHVLHVCEPVCTGPDWSSVMPPACSTASRSGPSACDPLRVSLVCVVLCVCMSSKRQLFLLSFFLALTFSQLAAPPPPPSLSGRRARCRPRRSRWRAPWPRSRPPTWASRSATTPFRFTGEPALRRRRSWPPPPPPSCGCSYTSVGGSARARDRCVLGAVPETILRRRSSLLPTPCSGLACHLHPPPPPPQKRPSLGA